MIGSGAEDNETEWSGVFRRRAEDNERERSGEFGSGSEDIKK